jgi:hypothetical protein
MQNSSVVNHVFIRRLDFPKLEDVGIPQRQENEKLNRKQEAIQLEFLERGNHLLNYVNVQSVKNQQIKEHSVHMVQDIPYVKIVIMD